MSEKIKVMICDDTKYLCEAVKFAIECEDDMEFVGTALSSVACLEALKSTECDVLLLDIRMETERAGIEAIASIKEIKPDIKIIMLTSYVTEEYVFAAFANGADDYCDKGVDLEDIISKVRDVYNNENVISPKIIKMLVAKTKSVHESNKSLLFMCEKMPQLTVGEYELLKAFYYGADYNDIAKSKCIELDSVYRMVSRILKKFDVKNMHILITHLRELKVFEFISQDIEN